MTSTERPRGSGSDSPTGSGRARGSPHYEALYRRSCRSPVCWTELGKRPSTGPDLIRDTFKKVDLILKRFLMAQSRQKSYANRQRRPLEFEVADHVFLKVMPKRGVEDLVSGESCRRGISSPLRYSKGFVQLLIDWHY